MLALLHPHPHPLNHSQGYPFSFILYPLSLIPYPLLSPLPLFCPPAPCAPPLPIFSAPLSHAGRTVALESIMPFPPPCPPSGLTTVSTV